MQKHVWNPAKSLDTYEQYRSWASAHSSEHVGESCLDDGIAIRGGRVYLIPRKAGPVVPFNVAPNETLNLSK